MELEDSIKAITRTDAIGKINALYNYRHTEKENQQLLLENEHKQNQVYLLIIGLLIIVGAAILYINYTRKQKRLAQEQAKRLSMLKDEQYKNSRTYIHENEKKIAALETRLQQTEGEKDALQKELIQSQKALLEVSNQKIEMSLNEKDCLEASLRQSDIYQLFHQVVRRDDDSGLSRKKAGDNFNKSLTKLTMISQHDCVHFIHKSPNTNSVFAT